GWPDPSTFNNVGAFFVWAVVFRNGKILAGTARMAVTLPISGNQVALTQDGTPWTQSATLSTLQAGDTLAIAPFGGRPPMRVNGGNALTVSNATFYGTPGNALQMFAANSTVDHVRVMPRPGELIGSNADGIDLGNGPNNHLRNSYVTATLDDALTVRTEY